MGKSKKKGNLSKLESLKKEIEGIESLEEMMNEGIEIDKSKYSEKRKGIYDEITQELKAAFSQPKFGLTNRTTNVMARIDEKTSKILDALVELELAPSRSSAAAYLMSEGILHGKETFDKILESYETIRKAKKMAQFSFYKSIKEEESDEDGIHEESKEDGEHKEDKKDIEDID